MSNPRRWLKRRKNALIFRGRVLHLVAFCKKHNLHPSYISRVLNGKQSVESMTVQTVEKLAAAFNCSIEELVLHLRLRQSLQKSAPAETIPADTSATL